MNHLLGDAQLKQAVQHFSILGVLVVHLLMVLLVHAEHFGEAGDAMMRPIGFRKKKELAITLSTT